jgi:hypothetical protein
LIYSYEFKERHRQAEQYFSRARLLTWPIMIMVLIQKSAKSMQLVLNEFFKKLQLPLVTSSAFTQARRHLRHTAFIELNQKAIVEVCYADDDYARYQGFRVLGVDGSVVYLPRNPQVIAEFGGSPPNQHTDTVDPHAQASVLYDVLNHIALDSSLAPAHTYEVELAIAHLAHTQPDDLLVFDRNYANYVLLATLTQRSRQFVIRCSRASFQTARTMFGGTGPDSQTVTLKAPQPQRKTVRALGLPSQIRVRFVRVMLASGEPELLVTSLLDESRYPTAEFGRLYFLRWGTETFYDILKTRLLLENFTGKTVEAVKQDFYATIYLTGLETLLTQAAQSRLDARSASHKHPQRVNRAVSFNAIKTKAAELFATEANEEALLDELTQLFLTKPTVVRKGRSVPRPKFSAYKRLQFHKRFQKICF